MIRQLVGTTGRIGSRLVEKRIPRPHPVSVARRLSTNSSSMPMPCQRWLIGPDTCVPRTNPSCGWRKTAPSSTCHSSICCCVSKTESLSSQALNLISPDESRPNKFNFDIPCLAFLTRTLATSKTSSPHSSGTSPAGMRET